MAKSAATFFLNPTGEGAFALYRAGQLVIASTTAPLLAAASYLESIGKPADVTVIIKDRETRQTLMFGKVGRIIANSNPHTLRHRLARSA